MAKQTRNPQSHLIALEPRMMFDGAAVVTAAATLSSADVLDNNTASSHGFAADNNGLTGDTVPNIGLAPPITSQQDLSDRGSDVTTVDTSSQDDQLPFSSGFVAVAEDGNNMATTLLDGVDGEPLSDDVDTLSIAAAGSNPSVSVAETVLSVPVNTDPVLVPSASNDLSTSISERITAKEQVFLQQAIVPEASDDADTALVRSDLAYQDALQPESISYDIREPGVRPVEFRDYFIIDDNDSRSHMGPVLRDYQADFVDDVLIEQAGAASGQDYIFIDTNVEIIRSWPTPGRAKASLSSSTAIATGWTR